MSLASPSNPQVTIILSSGRTGTTSLARCLEKSCDMITARHEPKPSRSLRVASGRYMAGKNSHLQMAEALRKARRTILSRLETPHYIESNPYLYGFLDVLGDVFDGPRIVHVTRDPRTSIRSVLNFGSHHGLKGLLLEWLPYWTVKPEHLDEEPAKRWAEMDLLERTAWFWQLVNGHLCRGAELYGESYRHFRYEDLFAADGKGMTEFTSWLGIEVQPAVFSKLLRNRHNASSDNRAEAWNDWTSMQQELLLRYCSDLMQKLGYSI